MTKKNKAILFSILIFPGSGFFVLGKKHIGYSFAAVSLIFLILVIIDATHKANIIANNFVNSVTRHGLVDPQLLIAKLDSLPGFIREQMLITPSILPEGVNMLSSFGLLAIWVIGIAGLWAVKNNIDD